MRRQDDYSRITLRLPPDLHEKVRVAAGDRSLNAEIIARLERSFDEDDTLQGHEDRLQELERQIEELGGETDQRLDRIEDRVWRLLEHAGLYDPNPEK
jgi:tetrahydromethanopterin S-methyltransferase subunit G